LSRDLRASDTLAFMRKLLAVLLFAHAALGATTGREVADRIREHGTARVFVLLRNRTTALTVDDRALRALEGDPNVVAIDLDVPGHGGDAESLPLIGGNTVQAMGFRGDGITVAVLDSGFDPKNADLTHVVVDEHCFCRNADGTGCCPNKQTTQSGPGAARDENGHGTNVTGIIASQGGTAPIGVAPGVKVVSVRVLDANNAFAGISQVVDALQWVADNHPEVRVINMSLLTGAHFEGHCDQQSSYNQAISALVKQLRARGTLVFACSGNTASPTSMGSPACVDPVTAVGAVYDSALGTISFGCTDKTTAADQITCFTDSDFALDLLAPGAVITSTGLNAPLSTYRGTSQASPHAAGAAAVLMSMRPELTADAVETILTATGKPLFDARNGVTTPRIDLLAAVQALQNTRPKRRATRH
jgi:subtilisin family serine protease